MLKLLLPALLLFSSIPAFACSCARSGSPDMSYAQASAVFTATITVMKESRQDRTTGFHFARGKSWKGDAPTEFIVPLGPCALENVQSGAEYLVYAGENLAVSMCSRSKLLKQARIEAQYLDELQGGRRTDLAARLPGALTGAEDENMRAEAATLMNEVLMSRELRDAAPASFLPALLLGATDKSAMVRVASVQTLGKFRTTGGVGALIAALQDEDRDVRAATVNAIGMTFSGDSPLFSALVASLKRAHEDPNPDREQQEKLLSQLSRALPGAAATEAEKGEAAKLLQGLIDEIKEPYKRVAPIQHLGMMGARARDSAPQLLRVLKTTDHYSLKQYTIIALGDIGASEMQVDLEPYLKDGNCGVVQAVVQAVWKMNKEGFGRFFVEKGMPEMKSRFDNCTSEVVTGLRAVFPAGREMQTFVTNKYNAMADSDSRKSTVKPLLDMWMNAP